MKFITIKTLTGYTLCINLNYVVTIEIFKDSNQVGIVMTNGDIYNITYDQYVKEIVPKI